MTLIVVGSGKLAQEMLAIVPGGVITKVIPWSAGDLENEKEVVVVHAGSGRELKAVFDFCKRDQIPLIDLATTTVIDKQHRDFPLIVCPNANILLLKFLAMLSKSGALFDGYSKTIVESHQSTKSSAPATAHCMAQSLGIDKSQVVSVRDPEAQEKVLGIPHEFLARHAYHKISIGDSSVGLTFETRVFGPAPYGSGLVQIVGALAHRKLENRVYDVLEFIDSGWI